MKQKVVALFLTALIFFLIFRNIDLAAFHKALQTIRYDWLFAALAYFLIYPWIRISLWKGMIELRHPFPFFQAFKIYFLGETLNLILPSKAGDVSRGLFLKRSGIASYAFGMSSIVFEKLLDFLSLGIIFLTGLAFVHQDKDLYMKILMIVSALFCVFLVFLFLDKARFIKALLFRTRRKKLLRIFYEVTSLTRLMKKKRNLSFLALLIGVTVLFWFGHMLQIFCFFKAANMPISYIQVLFYVPIAILVSLIPITIGGMGTRDLTLIGLLSPLMPKELIVLGGLLISLRYFVPALFGLLFIRDGLDFMRKRKL